MRSAQMSRRPTVLQIGVDVDEDSAGYASDYRLKAADVVRMDG